MTDQPKHSVSVAGVAVDGLGRVLVVQRRDNSHWEPPGGVLELDETPQEGVCREILEETGVEVVVDHLSGVYKNLSAGVVALVFHCRPIRGLLSATPESKSVKWMTLSEVKSVMLPVFAIRVTDAFNSGTAVRTHDGKDLVEG